MGLTHVGVPEKEYPDPVIRQSIPVFPSLGVDHGTSNPTLDVGQFIPLFLAGSKGAYLDFVRYRWSTDADQDVYPIIRYVANGTVANGSGTALTSGTGATSVGAGNSGSVYALTLLPANNNIPGNALVYADLTSAVTGLAGLVFDVGHRDRTN